jgi:glycosyltransferase involved in cell wall biosynthesis
MPATTANGSQYRTLLISHDVMGERMAGPGIRYYQLSRVLSRFTDLTLAILPQNEQAVATMQAKLPDVSVVAYRRGDWPSLEKVMGRADIVILSPYTMCEIQQFGRLDCALVLDGYDPLLIEWLTTLPPNNFEEQTVHWSERMVALFFQYLRTDFFICASERQRYWWLGQLEVAGRINPHTFQQDPSLRSLIDVVSYGLPEEAPQHRRQVVKGVWPGIGPDDVVLLWGGGLWPWLDPLTAVQAIAQLHTTYPQLKLIFPGTIHPNPEVQKMPVRNGEIFTWVEEQGLLNKAVFFGDWVPYTDWPDVLLESDIALSLHHETVETQLAYRSRVLEYIWAGLPVITTCGDATSELISRYNLGKIVDYCDVAGVIQAVLDILNGSKTAYQASLATARHELTWEKAAEPLIQFCLNPRRAADHPAAVPGGVPYYKAVLEQHKREVTRLEQLVAGYERGNFIRLMRVLHHWRRRLTGK